MSPFRVIDHTSDVGIEVKANSLEKLFSDAVNGLFFLLTDQSPEQIDISKNKIGKLKLHIKYSVIEDALIEILNRIILLTYSRKVLIFNPVIKIKKKKIVLKGKIIKKAFPLIEREIKAATYHNFSIKKRNGLYYASVVFDI